MNGDDEEFCAGEHKYFPANQFRLIGNTLVHVPHHGSPHAQVSGDSGQIVVMSTGAEAFVLDNPWEASEAEAPEDDE